MEVIAPPLKLLIDLRYHLENGASPATAIRHYLRTTKDDYSLVVTKWFAAWEQGQETNEIRNSLKSPWRRAVLDLAKTGLSGQPILNRVIELEEDLVKASREEIEKSTTALSFRLLIPLLLFQFPAILIILFGPLISNLIRSF